MASDEMTTDLREAIARLRRGEATMADYHAVMDAAGRCAQAEDAAGFLETRNLILSNAMEENETLHARISELEAQLAAQSRDYAQIQSVLDERDTVRAEEIKTLSDLREQLAEARRDSERFDGVINALRSVRSAGWWIHHTVAHALLLTCEEKGPDGPIIRTNRERWESQRQSAKAAIDAAREEG